jgi:hypothetical protein
VKHEWWIPKPDRTECLIHFVNECISNGSNPLEIMFSSTKGRKNSSNEEKISIWRSYITKTSNKIDIKKLPKSVRYLHSMPSSSAMVTTEGSGRQRKESCTSTKMKTDKISGKKRLVEVIGKEKNSKKQTKKGVSTNSNRMPMITNENLTKAESPGVRKLLVDFFVHVDLWTVPRGHGGNVTEKSCLLSMPLVTHTRRLEWFGPKALLSLIINHDIQQPTTHHLFLMTVP